MTTACDASIALIITDRRFSASALLNGSADGMVEDEPQETTLAEFSEWFTHQGRQGELSYADGVIKWSVTNETGLTVHEIFIECDQEHADAAFATLSKIVMPD
jgi:hypothetical protein